ncbi:MAG: diphosphomevalonate decarboxylase [Bacteroidetes bacterium]|nr:diphosphomevalonate decarboxylase [Bacteroidota bacterium]
MNQLNSTISTCWRSPSNIAFIKYWGKIKGQYPKNPSISMTLNEAYTETRLTASPRGNSVAGNIELFLDGKLNTAFSERIIKLLPVLLPHFPFLSQVDLRIDTTNTFPHSSGIASSASGFSALALCLCSIEEIISGNINPDFYQKASFIARLGSGSACRSLYPGITIWGSHPSVEGSTNEFAIPLKNLHPVFSGLRDAILLVDTGEKKVSSSKGHERMDLHPFGQARIMQAFDNISILMTALAEGDIPRFISIIENEAMSLHALMMTSDPGFILMEPETVRMINLIKHKRETDKLPICFTLDAGPNIHLIYFEKDHEQVRKFIVEDLLQNNKQNNWIDDKIGTGPKKIV